MDISQSYAKRRSVGVIGGTFDPIHYGHLAVAEEVRRALHLEEMVFVPAGQPPHKPGRVVSSAQHRLAMLELALSSNPHFSISLVDLERSGPSYTVEMLRDLHRLWGEQTAIYFLIGWDSLEYLTTWYDAPGILAQLSHVVAVHRPGYVEMAGYLDTLQARLPGIQDKLLTVPAPQLDISATNLRTRVTENRPIKYQVPEPVEQYILSQGLYRDLPAHSGSTQGNHDHDNTHAI